MSKFYNTPNKEITDTEGNKHWISPSVSVDALVIVGEQVLVVKRSEAMSNAGLWCLPCGFMDWNECPHFACIRELLEETGIDIRELNPINSDSHRPHALNGTALQFEFRLQGIPTVNINTEECVDYKWISLNDLDSLEWAFFHDELITYFL